MKSPRNTGISALIAIDKPKGMSSHDCVGRARRILQMKRIGHAGTLDPDATGVLVLGVGSATKLMGLLTQDSKSYRAHVCFGIQTTTDDAEGEILQRKDVPQQLYDELFVTSYVSSLVGKHNQVPPQFSAISVNGKRAYKSARAGEHVDLEARPIEIFDARFNRIVTDKPLTWEIDVTVSKGTYIRSLARDIGCNLGTAAHITLLDRLSSGLVTKDMTVSFEVLEALSPDHVHRIAINPLSVCSYDGYKELSEDELFDVQCGRFLSLDGVIGSAHQHARIALLHDDKLFGFWTVEKYHLKSSVNFTGGVWGAKRG